MKLKTFVFFFFLPVIFYGAWVGCPGQSALLKEGLIFKNDTSYYFFSSLFFDYVYSATFHDTKQTRESYPQKNTRSTIGADIHLILKRLDLYGFLGTSKFDIEKEIPKHDAFLWGAGLAVLLWQEQKFYVTLDGKYLQFEPKIHEILYEESPHKVLTDFFIKYEEFQLALTLGYQMSPLFPYGGILYEKATKSSHPGTALFELNDSQADFSIPSAENENKIGMVLGCSFYRGNIFSLNAEARFFTEFACFMSAAFRF